MNKSLLIFACLLLTAVISGTIVISRLFEKKELNVPQVLPTVIIVTPLPAPSPTITPAGIPAIDAMPKPSVNVRRGDDDLDDD